MASALYLENFIESIETLPQELQRNFTLMRSLDQRTEDLKAEIEATSTEYVEHIKSLPQDDRQEKLDKTKELFRKATEHSDNKVQIAMQMYEMVDKHIRRLDNDLTRFEQELQMKDPSVRRSSISSMSDICTPALKSRKRGLGESSSSAAGRNRKRPSMSGDEPGPSGLSSPPPPLPTLTALTGRGGGGGPTDVLDMPVDPNEPTYCLCHQVSFGEMIGCDNTDCPIEWFHFQCVGLAAKPKGKWYCPKCSQDRDKSKKKY